MSSLWRSSQVGLESIYQHSLIMIRYLAFSVWLATLVSLRAQPIFGHATSLELTVLDAEVVLIGKIDRVAVKGEDTTVTVSVEETLKGPGEHKDKVTIHLGTNIWGTDHWKADPKRKLLTANWKDSRLHGNGIIELTEKRELPVVKADFSVLWKPDEILREARQILAARPGVARVYSIRLDGPPELVKIGNWRGGAGVKVTVPVSPELLRYALQQIKENGSNRTESVRALRYFRSEETIALCKKLLKDSKWAYLRHPINNNGVEVRRYLGREAAYENLRAWGIKVEKPVLEEEHYRPDVLRKFRIEPPK